MPTSARKSGSSSMIACGDSSLYNSHSREAGLSGDQIDAILAEAAKATGAASQQARAFASDAQNWLERFPKAADYTPGEVL